VQQPRVTGWPLDMVPGSSGGNQFQLYDRRVNLDAFGKDAPLYSLLRAWIQDDPSRPV
ncbi:unnamed protein product, partial [Phaeothamnion confervicola]